MTDTLAKDESLGIDNHHQSAGKRLFASVSDLSQKRVIRSIVANNNNRKQYLKDIPPLLSGRTRVIM